MAIYLGSSTPQVTEIIQKTISGTYINSEVSFIKSYAFRDCSNLTSISFLNCTYIYGSAFYSCYSLVSANFPNCSYIATDAFRYCSSLTSVSFPSCTRVQNFAFQYCSQLALLNFPNCSYIGNNAFQSCYNLLSLYLTSVSSVTTLGSSSVFYSTPIGGYTTLTGGVYGSVYVPASLYSDFITATNWSSISMRIVSI